MEAEVYESIQDDNCSYSNFTIVPFGSVITTMVSSFASMIGSSLIILTFIRWPDLRTVARAILVFLAIADFLSGAGYIFASILFLKYGSTEGGIPPKLCTFQSFVTTTFPISSFLWTANLAVYLFVSITLRKAKVAKKLVLLFHVTGWGIPLLLCIPGAATRVLGRQDGTQGATQGTVTWCWVSFNDTFNNHTDIGDAYRRINELHVLELVFGKCWEIAVCVLAIVLCACVKFSLHKTKQEVIRGESIVYGSFNSEKVQAALAQLDQKLIWIPIVFILFRFWSTLRWIIASTSSECVYNIDRNCSVLHEHIWFSEECLSLIYNPGLVYMQSIGDTGQGWANALLYVIFHATIAKRLCPCLFACWSRFKNSFNDWQRNIRRKGYSEMDGSEIEKDVALSASSQLMESQEESKECSTDPGKSQHVTVATDTRTSINSMNT